MADQQTPPPKPKVGSLRDRIAAFEKPAASSAASPPPTPRPKPAGASWKPSPPSPQSGTDHSPNTRVNSSMNVSDAKDSITKVASLKERMAALQGRGGFGGGPAPPPPAAPKPAVEKPKWKPPPPQPQFVPLEKEKEDGDGEVDAPPRAVKGISIIGVRPAEEAGAEEEEKVELTGGEGDGSVEGADQEEERQRRAAIAARMARLGGARVGMAPMFGGPSVAKKSVSEEVKEAESTTVPSIRKSSQGEQFLEDSFDKPLGRKDSIPVSSPESEDQQQIRAPTSMPLPSAPRRAGPPRKKIPKTPEIPPAEVNQALIPPSESFPASAPTSEVPEAAVTVEEGEKGVEEEYKDEAVVKVEEEEAGIPPAEPSVATEPATALATDAEPEDLEVEEAPPRVPEDEGQISLAEPSAARDEQRKEEVEELVAPASEEAEVDEGAARRQRVAEKIAKMGGVNPFAPPPQRKPSLTAGEGSSIASPPPKKRTSVSPQSVRSPQAGAYDEAEPVPITAESDDQKDLELQDESSSPLAGQGTAEDTEEFEEPDAHDVEHHCLDDEDETEVKAERSKIDDEDDELDVIPESGGRSARGLASSNEPSRHLSDSPSPAPPPTQPGDVLTGEDPADFSPVPTTHAIRRSIPPPPPRLVPQPTDIEDDASGSDAAYTPDLRTAALLASALSSRQPSDDEDDDSEAQPRRIPPRNTSGIETPPLPVPNRLSKFAFRSLPRSPPASDVESDYDNEALPRRPMTPGTPPAANEVPLVVPPRVGALVEEVVKPSPLRHSYRASVAAAGWGDPSSPGSEPSPSHLSPPLTAEEKEIIDEEEGDPIDPAFHSPPSRRVSAGFPSSGAHTPPQETQETVADYEEEEQKAHRQTIAERMAKLGGIKFGAAAPPVSGVRPPAPRLRPVEDEGAFTPAPAPGPEEEAAGVEAAVETSEEEGERARKERIAAKLASMGGMRIGMLPLGGGARRPHTSHILTEQQQPVPVPPSPSVRTVPPPRPPLPLQHQDSDLDIDSSLSASFSASEDGVKVEAEESEIEIEEVSLEEAQEEFELEEVPPPVPSRGTRRRGTGESSASQASTVPPARSVRKGSLQTTTTSVGRKSSVDDAGGYTPRRPDAGHKPQSDYVMVEEPVSLVDEVPPPLPPGRHSVSVRSPPARTAPRPPPAPLAPAHEDSLSSQWELPSISSTSLEFSDGPDLSLSWTDAASPIQTSPLPHPPPSPRPSIPPPQPIPVPAAERQLSSDELMAVWGRVGVQICEVATTLHDKSKRALVGDGTHEGFVNAVLAEVPNAAWFPLVSSSSESEYGYLVYAQTGNAVQKRVSEILPGDVVELRDARLKGHKGLQAYNQSVEHAVGVVSEFEPKKSKVRAFQANLHVGQQTVEAVSYRLEDLKSGTVKIYRVLEN